MLDRIGLVSAMPYFLSLSSRPLRNYHLYIPRETITVLATRTFNRVTNPRQNSSSIKYRLRSTRRWGLASHEFVFLEAATAAAAMAIQTRVLQRRKNKRTVRRYTIRYVIIILWLDAFTLALSRSLIHFFLLLFSFPLCMAKGDGGRGARRGYCGCDLYLEEGRFK